MKITIADIAERAGVSKATVSRVLNKRPEGVGEQTRQRIEAILAETGFQPSGVARGLATGKSRTVGLIIPNIANPYFPMLVRGVEAALSESGYSLLLCNSGCDITKEKNYVRVLMEKGVDGVILDSAESDCDCQVELLDRKNVPLVLLDRNIQSGSKRYGVFVDNRQGARLATGHFVAKDDCRLFFINGPAELSQCVQRRAGVEEVWRASGLPADALTMAVGDDSVESGYRLTLAALVGSRPGDCPFNSLFAGNDLMAVGAIRALKAHGLAIPEQVEVIGFDDIELAHLVDPPLSTISQPAFEMGARSAELLLRLIDGKPPEQKTLIMMPEMILRGTTRVVEQREQREKGSI